MTNSSECKQNTDASRLMHEGSSQDLRVPKALDPGHVPVNERGPEYGLVFAKAYSAYLNYYDPNNSVTGDWQSFFDKDVSVLLAVAAIQDVDAYRSAVKACFDFLNNSNNRSQAEALKQRLGFLFSIAATMAKQLDRLKENLPVDTALKNLLQSRIQSQSAPGFKRLIAYYKAYESDFGLTDDELDVAAELTIFGQEAQAFGDIYRSPFSKDWIIGDFPDWPHYIDSIVKDAGVFGPLLDPSDPNYWFSILNPVASHNLFTSLFDELLKIYARIVIEAKQELENSFIQNGNHEPHYALLIAFLRLFEGTRAEINTLTGRHLDFYYRDILRLKEKPAEPPRVHLLAELAKHADSHRFDSGVSFKAGKDDSGIEAFFTSERDFIANKAKVAALKTVYRHDGEAVTGLGVNAAKQSGRYYASPVADSEDGLGAKLANEEQSWHPFFNKRYSNTQLESIAMPEAELGFAIASHYLWLAEGERTVTVEFYLSDIAFNALPGDLKADLVCSLSTEEGWLEKSAMKFESVQGRLQLKIKLSGADPAITAYSPKVHGFGFSSNLPILLVKFRHQSDRLYPAALLANAVLDKIGLNVAVKGLRSLKVSNDFGSVVTSKPFQPFGPSPVANSSLILGSKEAFQKKLLSAKVNWQWQNPPEPFDTQVNINVDYLQSGTWKQATSETKAITSDSYTLDSEINQTIVDAADFNEPVFYNSASRHGFVRFSTSESFGQDKYEKALIDYIRKLMDNDKELAKGVQASVDFIGQINTRVQEFNDLHNSVIENLSQLPTQMAEVTNDLIEKVPEVIENTEKVFEKINHVYGEAETEIQTVINNLLQQFPDVGIDLDVVNGWSNLTALSIPDDASEGVPSLIGRLNQTVIRLSTLKDTVVDIAKEIEKKTGVANLTQTVNTFLSLVDNTYDDIDRIASEMIKLDNAAKWVTEKTSVVMSAGSQLIENFGAQIVQFNNNVAGLVAGVSTMVEGIGEVLGGEPIKPKPPTGPWMTELTLDYATDEQMIALDSTDSGIWRNRQAFFFHLAPFGQCEQHPFLNSTRKVYLIPGFRFQQDHGEIMSGAEFYIGLTGLVPPQNLSLLFQVADGTADPLTIKPDPHIHWSYLRGNEWIAFKTDEVEDGTGGLLNSGIIRFALPNDADNNNSILPAGMHWLRAAVASHSEAVCRLQAVAAQALQATFSDRGNNPGFSAKPLKAGTISQLERPDAVVKKIEQPFSSFGGRGAETPAAFYARVSERLRHKDRAVALWDYEHLVLEAFPQIYRVKCLNHTQYEPGENGDFVYRELAPGHVTLIAIPNLEFQTFRDPLKPYTSLGLLDEIKDFLSARVSCFVNLHVRNPLFETVRCSCKVRFHEGFDETFYSNTLRQAITRFLSPWAFANDAKPFFGGKIHQSVLIRFVEEQTYVDYLTDFVLYHDSGGAAGDVAVHDAAGSTAASILVSAPAGEHQIDVIKPAAVHELGETCPCEP
ncbi:baseplate J/gp47 family protein [Methylotuvimicrobium sp. KM1]|uniref:baseplate J/gp47 family protein n=1 Tax=Methylotuvimicrobium sp. KM1 TaxID=3377707 RepID=UPI00384B27C0